MKQPDTIIAKYLFLIFIGIIIFIIFSMAMWILNLSGRCSGLTPKIEDKKGKKKNNTIIYLLIFVLVCSMTAQAVNQSYTRIVPNAINATFKTS
jgi:hypothetical protein